MTYCIWLDETWKIIAQAVAKLNAVVSVHLQLCTQLFVVIRLYNIMLWEWLYILCLFALALMAAQFGQVVIIRKDGTDGPAFLLRSSLCFGRWDCGNKMFISVSVSCSNMLLCSVVAFLEVSCDKELLQFKWFLKNLSWRCPHIMSNWVCGSPVGHSFHIVFRCSKWKSNSLTSVGRFSCCAMHCHFLVYFLIYSWQLSYEC